MQGSTILEKGDPRQRGAGLLKGTGVSRSDELIPILIGGLRDSCMKPKLIGDQVVL